MRALPLVPAALVVAIGVAAAPQSAFADSPVVIEGGDEDMRDAIAELLPDRDRPESLFDAERIAEEAAARALAWLRSEGYYGATVTPEATEEPAVARLVIEPGPRFAFDAPQIAYVGDAPSALAQTEATRATGVMDAGAPARAEDVLAAEAGAVLALQNAGYAGASAEDRRVVVDHAQSRVSTEFRLNAGPLVRLGAVRAEPSDLIRPSFIDGLQNWEDAATYEPEMLSRLRRDLSSTGAVSLAATRIEPPGADGLSDVVLNVEPARRNAYELGVSYSTTEGAGVEGEWTRRNFTRRADSLVLGATLAEMNQGVSIDWIRPHTPQLGHTLTIGAEAEHEDIDAYSRQGVALYGSVDASPDLRIGRSYGLRLSADHYNETNSNVRDAVVLSAFGAIRNDTTESRFDPRDGSIVDLRFEPSVSTGDETLGFIRFIAEGRVYESMQEDDRLTLAARLRAGWLTAVSGDPDDVPPDRRFYAGGGGSVRGYEYNSIYPEERDLLGLTPGGQGLLEGSIEARYRFDDRWGVAAFVDGGTAFDDVGDATDLSWAVGAGLRYDLGFAPLRIDFAVPLDDDEANQDFALYISIGQAF